jgi:hypothetical protein
MISVITTPTLVMTIRLLTLADSRTPTIRIAVTTSTIRKAGRLKTPCTTVPSASVAVWNGPIVHCGGMPIPNCPRKLITSPAQPTDTVAAPSAYSRIRSQPMIHATNSPSVA